jgi:hypothetical protein
MQQEMEVWLSKRLRERERERERRKRKKRGKKSGIRCIVSRYAGAARGRRILSLFSPPETEY